jgi:hypothetical protein
MHNRRVVAAQPTGPERPDPLEGYEVIPMHLRLECGHAVDAGVRYLHQPGERKHPDPPDTWPCPQCPAAPRRETREETLILWCAGGLLGLLLLVAALLLWRC